MTQHAQKQLIKQVWPDKLLYGAIMLLVTALVGFLHALVVSFADITISQKLPAIVRFMPPEGTAILSGTAAVLAFVSLRNLRTSWGIWGAIAGVLAFGLLGLGSILSLVALGFLAWGRAEGEDDIPEENRLSVDAWPDKSLGASLVLLLNAFLNLAWGAAVFTGSVEFGGNLAAGLGGIAIAGGLVSLVAAYLTYHQKGFWVGVVGAVAGVASFAAWVLSPILSLVGIVLLLKARREGEFDG